MRKLKLLVFGALFSLALGTCQGAWAGGLHIYAGAGLRQPVDRLVQAFETQTGQRVFIDYGGSGQLLTKIEALGQGDLFIPGALFYITQLEMMGKIRSYRPIVKHTPVIGVNIHQTGRVTTLSDLARAGIRLALGDPKAMALGRTALSILERSGKKDAILKNVTVYGATVKQLALYVSQGVVDAAIIGRADVFQSRAKIAMVPIAKEYFEAEIVAAAVLHCSANPVLAEKLSKHLSSHQAMAVFRQYGFLPLDE